MRTRFALVMLVAVGIVLSLATVAMAKEYVPGDPLKVGFIYVGPIGDLGWSYAHN